MLSGENASQLTDDLVRKLRGILKRRKRGDVDAAFDEFDTNGDGVLDVAEQKAMAEALTQTESDYDKVLEKLQSAPSEAADMSLTREELEV